VEIARIGYYVLFVDKVKAVDTVNRQILFSILRKYGIPEELIIVIKCMYTYCEGQVKAGKDDRSVPHRTVVQQGDNVAPVMFLFSCTYGHCPPPPNGRNVEDF
jgi:hypothetical protein